MASQLGPIEIHCDAPSYSIVAACRQLGFRQPEDVAWYRLHHFINGQYDQWRSFDFQALKTLLGWQRPKRESCICGQPLPETEMYTFTLLSGTQVSYFIGQCRHCRTIFWDEP